MEFNEVLKSLLKERGISQRELAKATGITPAQISRYVSGARTPQSETLIILSDYFGISLDKMMGYEAKAGSPYNKVLASIEENKPQLTSEERMLLISKLSS